MPERIAGWNGAPQTVYSDHFLWEDGVTGKAGFKLEVPPTQPALISTLFGLYGQEHADWMEKLPHLHIQLALQRDGFHPESPGGTVQLRQDGSGELDYPMNDYFWEGMERAWRVLAESQFAAGGKNVRVSHLDGKPYQNWAEARVHIPTLRREANTATVGSAHVMGGCTMGEDEKRSVVDSLGTHRQLKNLSVLDGSVFPTSIGANPQVSIFAMTAKNTNALITRLQKN
jgi:choline dehydrogenase-like flavoprotein